MSSEVVTLTASRADRLDRVIAALLPALSRSAAQRLIAQGHVHVEGRARDADFRVQAGQVISVTLPSPPDEQPQAEPIDLSILYEDASVIVINKPAGMVVHPAPGNPNRTVVNAVLAYAPEVMTVGDAQRPGIVHRLDKETSGVMLIARNQEALLALQSQFKSRVIRKTYLALCVGHFASNQGVVEHPIARHPIRRQQMAVVAHGRPAVTRYIVKERLAAPDGSRYTLVRAHPLTGRTHQLRVHLAALGHPIVGDALYGARRDPLTRALRPRQLLHASELAFISPATGQEVKAYAPLPDDIGSVLASLFNALSALDQ